MGENEAARVLAEMPARRAGHELAGEIEALGRKRRSERLRFSASTCLSSTPSSEPQPQTWEDSILMRSSVEAQRLADVADRALGAITNHGRAEGGVIPAVLVEDPLHDDLPAGVHVSKSTSMSGGSWRSSETKRSNKRSFRAGSIEVMPRT